MRNWSELLLVPPFLSVLQLRAECETLRKVLHAINRHLEKIAHGAILDNADALHHPRYH